jgi:hypothetical protein
MAEKNYTVEMEAALIAGYDPEGTQDERTASVKALAVEVGKTTRSVVAKLSRMGVYVAKEYRTKNGAKSVSKAAIVGGIAALIGVNEDTVGSLEKATKPALTVVFNAISEAQEIAAFAEADEVDAETA